MSDQNNQLKSTYEVFVQGVDEVINAIYQQLSSMGLYFHLGNGEVDVMEIISRIEDNLPDVYPTYIKITCQRETDDVRIFIEELC